MYPIRLLDPPPDHVRRCRRQTDQQPEESGGVREIQVEEIVIDDAAHQRA